MTAKSSPDSSEGAKPSIEPSDVPSSESTATAADGAAEPLRLWPGLVIPVVAVAIIFAPGIFAPASIFQVMGMLGGPLLGLLLASAWWILTSRATWTHRLVIVAAFIVGALITAFTMESSMGFPLFLYGWAPAIVIGTLWLYATPSMSGGPRIAVNAVVVILCWTFWALLRFDGMDGSVLPELSFRWSQTAEERYLASLENKAPPNLTPGDAPDAADDPTATPASDSPETTPPPEPSITDWPEFRGAKRDGHVFGVRLDTDWAARPPREVWRRPIGPGWSSFAVVGNRLFTQEQRGEEEVVLCLNAETGEEIWHHSSNNRFTEAIGGAGPRATPTYHDGKIYALGANGRLDCLQASDGAPVWSAEIASDGKAATPVWGFSSSPLVTDDLVYVFAGGGENGSLLAYDRTDGAFAWAAGGGAHSYSSAHYADVLGIPQILMVTEQGVAGFEPSTGEVLWDHDWEMSGYRVVQPIVVDDQVYIGTNNGMGTRRVDVSKDGDGWSADENWTSRGLKPYFNDFVFHKGHVYGFDNTILACLDQETGQREWKGGRYGAGQLLLLPEQDLMLVITEKSGEIVLVEAKPDEHRELARYSVLSGKTWNHPVIAGNRLYVRNGEEAACFELATLGEESPDVAGE